MWLPLYMEVQNALFELERDGRLSGMPPADIVKYVGRDRSVESMTFTEYMKRYMEGAKTEGTRKTFAYTLATLERFAGGPVRFAEINTAFLRKLDDDMEGAGIGTNTRGIVMRNIRTVVNRAIDEDLFPQGDYPFRKFKIKSQVKEPDCLDVEELRTFFAYEPVSPCEQMGRDAFMLSFFFCGANLKDIYHMGKAEGGKVSFVREKTRRKSPNPVHIAVQPEALEIINRIAGKETLVDFCERYDYETMRGPVQAFVPADEAQAGAACAIDVLCAVYMGERGGQLGRGREGDIEVARAYRRVGGGQALYKV